MKFPDFFTVADVVKITGLSERTIRTYLSDGRLQGKKVGVQWRFTEEDIKDLFSAPQVSQSIEEAKKGLVLDFLASKSETRPRLCFIYDIPCSTEKKLRAICEPVLDRVNALKSTGELRFSLQHLDNVARFILMGEQRLVQEILAFLARLNEETENLS